MVLPGLLASISHNAPGRLTLTARANALMKIPWDTITFIDARLFDHTVPACLLGKRGGMNYMSADLHNKADLLSE